MKNELVALDELKEKTAKLVTDKRTAIRKLENQAIERKNRCGQPRYLQPLPSWGGGCEAVRSSDRLHSQSHLSQ